MTDSGRFRRNREPLPVQAEGKVPAERLKATTSLPARYGDASRFLGLLTPFGVVVASNRPHTAGSLRESEQLRGMPVWEARWWREAPGVAKAVREAARRAGAGDSVRIEATLGTGANGSALDLSFEPLNDAPGAVKFVVTQWRELCDHGRNKGGSGGERAIHPASSGRPAGEALVYG